MTILVTGGAGYIGSQVARHLAERGEQIVVLDNFSTGHPSLVPPGARIVRGDVRERTILGACIRNHGVTEVLHFAGSISVEESMSNPALYYSNNTGATAALVEACAERGVKRLIFSSTAAVYGLPDVVTVPESSPLNPQSPYGHSKLLAEEIIVRCARSADMQFGVLRYFNVGGADPGGRGGQLGDRATHLIRNALRAAAGEIPKLRVFGADYPTRDGTGVRDFIHVADLAEAHVATLQYLRGGGESGIFNCGYGRGFTVLEVINVVKAVTGADFEVEIVGRRPGDVASIIADCSLAMNRLGWRPRLDDLSLIVRHAWEWEQRRTEFADGFAVATMAR